jgi:hypothetical protein
LFKIRRSEQLVGLRDLIQKIDDMGLSSYIVSKNNFEKKVSKSHKESEKKGQGESNEFPWYYIGP